MKSLSEIPPEAVPEAFCLSKEETLEGRNLRQMLHPNEGVFRQISQNLRISLLTKPIGGIIIALMESVGKNMENDPTWS